MKDRIEKEYDFVVVGGGMSGVCAAVAAARHGARVALVQNRPVLGGNNSSEIRMHVCGADLGGKRPDARETGIIEEIQEENRARNPNHCWSIYDTVIWEKTRFQDGLDLYLNTHFTQVDVRDNTIVSIAAEQMTSEKVFEFSAKMFVDATGDGTLAALAGAEYMAGREGKDVFGEQFAPDKSDSHTMGNTLLFKAVDTGERVDFRKPFWANTYEEKDLKFREHKEIVGGYWWIELGGKELDTITDAEEIRDELLRALYGVWDHIKNRGDHGAETYDLDWVGFLPGKRESRRLLGDYVLVEKDLMEGRRFDDAIAYGGWSIDLHAVGGLRNSDSEPATQHLEKYTPEDVFTIPYRCLYSKNIKNLFLAGRAISVSHVAFGATRQIATCSVVGQAVGTAGALALRKGILPRDVLDCIGELQQLLLKDDCHIPGVRNEDEKDVARKATVTCSSHLEGCDGANVINGHARRIKEDSNAWVSGELAKEEWLRLDFGRTINARQVILFFDPNLTKEVKISLSRRSLSRQIPGIPRELVKDYDVDFCRGDTVVHHMEVRENHLRYRVHAVEKEVECDRITLTVRATRGDPRVRVLEVRVYE